MSPLSVISLGGSLIAPNGGVDIIFLRKFHRIISSQIKKGRRFIVVTGGGGTARAYIQAARRLRGLTTDDMDWLGIHATRLNGHLLRTIFRSVAYPVVLKDPSRPLRRPWRQPLLVAAGWRPGWSTDYIAVRLAKRFFSSTVINLSSTPYLYERDPNKWPKAKPILRTSWPAYRAMISQHWRPGLHLPFDPVASRLAAQSKISVILLGSDMKNLSGLLNGRRFKGSVIK